MNTLSFTASDPNSSNLSQTATATLTVLDHAAAAFTNGSGTVNLNFGTLQAGSGTQALQFQIENLPAAYRAGLALDSVTDFPIRRSLQHGCDGLHRPGPRRGEQRVQPVPEHLATRHFQRPVPVQPVRRAGPERPGRPANADAQRDCGCRAGTFLASRLAAGAIGLLFSVRRRKSLARRGQIITFALSIFVVLIGQATRAQTLTTLVSFYTTSGQYPQAGVAISGYTLYGLTDGGANGFSGTVFSVPLSGGGPTLVTTIGANPTGGLTLSGNTLYGTTDTGGTMAWERFSAFP